MYKRIIASSPTELGRIGRLDIGQETVVCVPRGGMAASVALLKTSQRAGSVGEPDGQLMSSEVFDFGACYRPGLGSFFFI